MLKILGVSRAEYEFCHFIGRILSRENKKKASIKLFRRAYFKSTRSRLFAKERKTFVIE